MLSLLQNIRLKQNAKKIARFDVFNVKDSMKKCAQGRQKTNETKILPEFSECTYDKEDLRKLSFQQV